MLKKQDSLRQIYLAVERNVFETFFKQEVGELLLE
ncbi:hypothetical protein [Okeania sp. KiyG1]